MNEKFTDGCLDSNRAVRICCFKILCMIDFLEVGQSINVTRKYLHLLGFWEFIGRRCGEIKSSETQMFMLAVMQTGSYICQPARGHPKTQAMQTADCRLQTVQTMQTVQTVQTEYFFSNTWLTFFGSTVTNSVKYVVCLLLIHRPRKLDIWLLIQYKTNAFNTLCMGNSLYWS